MELSPHFWANVKQTPQCWLWTGVINASGYGMWQRRRAHRVAYTALVGPIPDGLQLDHLCRVRNCVRPNHLEPVTGRENVLRGVGFAAVHATTTHCPQGHPYSPENTYLYRGMRQCQTCRKLRNDRANAQRAALRAAMPKAERPRKSECAHGHPYDAANTHWKPNGKRECRTCDRLRHRVIAKPFA